MILNILSAETNLNFTITSDFNVKKLCLYPGPYREYQIAELRRY